MNNLNKIEAAIFPYKMYFLAVSLVDYETIQAIYHKIKDVLYNLFSNVYK